MQIKDIASKIIEMEKVPTYFNNTKTFLSVTYLKQNTDKLVLEYNHRHEILNKLYL